MGGSSSFIRSPETMVPHPVSTTQSHLFQLFRFTSAVWDKWRPSKWEQAQAAYWELATACRSEKLHSRKKGSLGGALLGGCWPGGAVGGLARSGASCAIGEGLIFAFLLFMISWKWGQKLGMLSASNQVLAIWGLIATEVTVCLPGLVAADCGSEFYFYT